MIYVVRVGQKRARKGVPRSRIQGSAVLGKVGDRLPFPGCPCQNGSETGM